MDEKLIVLNAVKVSQKIGDFYTTSISASMLVKISYSDVRRLFDQQRDLEAYLGIQRPVIPSRKKKIRKYLESPDATFPTAIIVAVDERCAEFEELIEGEGIGRLILHSYNDDEINIPSGKIAKVIDGQHRIAAFLNEKQEYSSPFENDDEFEFNVAVFVGADIPEQANIFATVNQHQTKVNRSLVYDLQELAKTPSPYKTCHNVAVVLDGQKGSPLYKRIKRLGTATPGRIKEPLTQQAFVDSLVKFISSDPQGDRNALLAKKKLPLVEGRDLQKMPFRNLFIESRDLDIAEIVYNYLLAVENKWPESWKNINKVGNLLPRANAFKALMKYLKDDVYLDVCEDRIGRIPTTAEFAAYFDHLELADEDFITTNFAPGSGGQSTFLKLLRGEIQLADMIQP